MHPLTSPPLKFKSRKNSTLRGQFSRKQFLPNLAFTLMKSWRLGGESKRRATIRNARTSKISSNPWFEILAKFEPFDAQWRLLWRLIERGKNCIGNPGNFHRDLSPRIFHLRMNGGLLSYIVRISFFLQLVSSFFSLKEQGKIR